MAEDLIEEEAVVLITTVHSSEVTLSRVHQENRRCCRCWCSFTCHCHKQTIGLFPIHSDLHWCCFYLCRMFRLSRLFGVCTMHWNKNQWRQFFIILFLVMRSVSVRRTMYERIGRDDHQHRGRRRVEKETGSHRDNSLITAIAPPIMRCCVQSKVFVSAFGTWSGFFLLQLRQLYDDVYVFTLSRPLRTIPTLWLFILCRFLLLSSA